MSLSKIMRRGWIFILGASLVVAGCNQGGRNDRAPTIAAQSPQVVVQGQTLAFVVSGSDPDPGTTLTYAAPVAPAGFSVDAVSGAVTWTPTFDQIGVHSLRLTVSDGILTAATTVKITVTADPAETGATLAGGSLDPLTIPKYVTPLVIPPVMRTTGVVNDYAIAARQFQQQILPGGVWNTLEGRADAFPATTVWGYGPGSDPAPDSRALGGGAGIAPAPNSQFNYPAYTVESIADTPVRVRWSNGLVNADGSYLPHLFTIDQTLHWANPSQECADGSTATDCMGMNSAPYTGPVPLVTHVHGAHVAGHSDGYPEAWWLPAANNIPAGYARSGKLFDDSTGNNPGNLGYADFLYRNDQPATTLWYHDHAMGMTRTNVYAGLAGFWLVRGDHTPTGGGSVVPDGVDDASTVAADDGVLPGPAPVAGDALLDLNTPGNPVRSAVREIPLVIQDRSFNADGSLFYPNHRAFFEGFTATGGLMINFAPNSDIAPYWNPEAFFNVMVVNGVSWPQLEVAPARYRFRLLNGCNSRFLNLALAVVDPLTGRTTVQEVPLYLIGTEQGALPQVVKITSGYVTVLPGNGTVPAATAAADPDQALLMAPAERFDVIIDFSSLPDGAVLRLINSAPDEPFGGFNGAIGEESIPDPLTTAQVMQFVVRSRLDGASRTDPAGATPATAPQNLVLKPEVPLGAPVVTRQISLNEEISSQVCATSVLGTIVQLPVAPAASSAPADVALFEASCVAAGGEPFGPKAAKLGTVDLSDPLLPVGNPLAWDDQSGASTPQTITLADGVTTRQVKVTEAPFLGDTEEWEIYNFTVDAHPIHLHLVRFGVIGRTLLDGTTPSPHGSVQPWETGYKDMVIAYPGEITRVKAKFDLAGLYVWHCHIVEHEDNEMMRPFVVVPGP